MSSAAKLFVGNVAWEVKAELIEELLRSVGPVLEFQLRPDPSGRNLHKGNGYVVYPDEQTASEAIRKLNGYMLYNRDLRVARFDSTGYTPATSVPQGPQSNVSSLVKPHVPQNLHAHTQSFIPNQSHFPQSHAPIQSHTQDPNYNVFWTDVPLSIRAVLEAMSPADMERILLEFQHLAINDTDEARTLLKQSPVLARVISLMLRASGELKVTNDQYVNAYNNFNAAENAASGTTAEDAERAHVRRLLTMSEEELGSLNSEEKAQAIELRQVLAMTDEVISSLPDDQRLPLLQLKQELTEIIKP